MRFQLGGQFGQTALALPEQRYRDKLPFLAAINRRNSQATAGNFITIVERNLA